MKIGQAKIAALELIFGFGPIRKHKLLFVHIFLKSSFVHSIILF